MRLISLTAALALASTLAFADEHQIADLTVERAVVKEASATAKASAGYLVISNSGDTADTLVAVKADFTRVMIHDTKIVDDVASMYHIDGVEIAPGATTMLRPRGKHIMFVGLDGKAIETDDTVSATLVFENAGELEVVFEVATLEDIIGELGTAN